MNLISRANATFLKDSFRPEFMDMDFSTIDVLSIAAVGILIV